MKTRCAAVSSPAVAEVVLFHHALAQAERLRDANGGRYSLWTGDVGTALFAAACLDVDARYPIVDVV